MTLPTRYLTSESLRTRLGSRLDKFGAALLRGDPLADEVVAAGLAQECHRALSAGHKQSSLPSVIAHFLEQAGDAPIWVERERLERGQKLFQRYGPFAGMILGGGSLILGYVSPAGNKPLAFSKRLESDAARRLAETAAFVHAIMKPGALEEMAEGYTAVLRVRLMHASIRQRLLSLPEWKTDDWGVPINQHDMVGTTLLFSFAVLEGLRTMGATISAGDAEDYIHLWRYLGWLMGVEETLLPASERDASSLTELIRSTQGPPDEDSRRLTHALLSVPLQVARTAVDKKTAPYRVAVASAVARELLGPELSEQLGIKASRAKFVLAPVRAAIRSRDVVGTRWSAADELCERAGLLYWDKIVQEALAGQEAHFAPQ